MKSKVLITCKNSIEAQLIKNQLGNEGIESYLFNENFSNLMPYMHNIMGSGVQVAVLESDFAKAREILKLDGPVRCPNCGSEKLLDNFARKENKFIAFLIALFLAGPVGNLLGNFKCEDCNTEFSR
ncbi:putative signal transducing protein [Ekhidna sp.]